MDQENTILPLQSELVKVPFETTENIYKNLTVSDLLTTRLVNSAINDEIKGFFTCSLSLSNIYIFTHALQKSLWRILKLHETEKIFLPENAIKNRIDTIFLPYNANNRITKESSIINLFCKPDLKIINLFNAHPFDFTRKDNTNAESHEIIQNKYQYIFLQNDVQGKENLKPLFKYIKENIENKTYKKSYTFIPETITSQINKYKKYLEYQPKTLIIPASLIITYNQSFVRIPDFIITYQKNITVSKHEEITEQKVLSHALVHIDEERPNYVIASILILSFNEILFDKKTVKDELVCIRDHICNELKTKYKTKKIFLKLNCKYYSIKTPFLEIFKDYSDGQVTISSALLADDNNDLDFIDIIPGDTSSKKYGFHCYNFFSNWYTSGKNRTLFNYMFNNLYSPANMFSLMLSEAKSRNKEDTEVFCKVIDKATTAHPEHYKAMLELFFDKNPRYFSNYFLKFEPMLDLQVKHNLIAKIIENTEPEQDFFILGLYALRPYLNTLYYKDFNFAQSTLDRIKQRSLEKDNFAYMPMICFQYFINHFDQYNDEEKKKVLENLARDTLFYNLTDENRLLITKEFIVHNDLFINFMQTVSNNETDGTLLLTSCIEESLFQSDAPILFDLFINRLKNNKSNIKCKIIGNIFTNMKLQKKFDGLPDKSLVRIFDFLYSKEVEISGLFLSNYTILHITENILRQLIAKRNNFSPETQQNILEAILTERLFKCYEVYQEENKTHYNAVLNLLAQNQTLYNTILEILFEKNPTHFSIYFLKFEPKLNQDFKNDFIKKIILLDNPNTRQLVYTQQLTDYFKTVNWKRFTFTGQEEEIIKQHSLIEIYFSQMPSLYFSYFVKNAQNTIESFIINSTSTLLDSRLYQSLFEKNGHVLLDIFFNLLFKNILEENDSKKVQSSMNNLLNHIDKIRTENIKEAALFSLYKFLSQNEKQIDPVYVYAPRDKIESICKQIQYKLIKKIDTFDKNDQNYIATIYTSNPKNLTYNQDDLKRINEFFIKHIDLFGDTFQEKWYAFLGKHIEHLGLFKWHIEEIYISLKTDIKKLIELYTQLDLEAAIKIHSDIEKMFRSFYDITHNDALLKIFKTYDTQGVNNAGIEVIFKNWLDVHYDVSWLIELFIEKQKLFLYFITIASQKEPEIIGHIAQYFYNELCHYQKFGGKDSQANTRSMEISNLINMLFDPNTPASASLVRPFIIQGGMFGSKVNQVLYNIIQNQPVPLFLEYFQHRELFAYIDKTDELKNQLYKKIETIDQLSIYLASIKNVDTFIRTINLFLENHNELLHVDFFKKFYSFLKDTAQNDFFANFSREEVALRIMIQHGEQLKKSWDLKQFCDFTLPFVEKLVNTLVHENTPRTIIVNYITTFFDSAESWNYYIQEYYPIHNEQKEMPIIVDFLRKNVDDFFKEKLSGSGKVIKINSKVDITLTDIPRDCLKHFIKMCVEKKHINYISSCQNIEFTKVLCSSIEEYFTSIQTLELDTDYAKQLIMLYRENLLKQDITLHYFEWFIENYIIQFHQENIPLITWCVAHIPDNQFEHFSTARNLVQALQCISKTYFDFEKNCMCDRDLIRLANTYFQKLSLDEYIELLTHLKALKLNLDQCNTSILNRYISKNTNNDLDWIKNIIKLNCSEKKARQCFADLKFSHDGAIDIINNHGGAINIINNIENMFYKKLYMLSYVKHKSSVSVYTSYSVSLTIYPDEEKIVDFIKTYASSLLKDPYCCAQLLNGTKLQSNLFCDILFEACDLLKAQQFDLFCSDIAQALNFFSIPKESMLFSYIVKYMNDEIFIDTIFVHLAELCKNKTDRELVDILCNMQWHEEMLPLQKRFVDQLYIQSNILSHSKNYKEFIRQISEILKKWNNEEKKDPLLVDMVCNIQWDEEILPLQKKFVDQLYTQSPSNTENHKEFIKQISEILEKWNKKGKKDSLLVNILCNMQWHDEILPLQKRFIDQLCVQPNLLLSFENYKRFIEEILKTLKTSDEPKKQSLKKFLQHCGKPTFWHYFLETFLTSDKLTGEEKNTLLSTLIGNNCCIEQFQQPEIVEHALPSIFKAFITHCSIEQLCPRLKLIKKCDSEHIKITAADSDEEFELMKILDPQYIRVMDSVIDFDGTIKSITQKIENLENAIEYYPHVVPQFFKQQYTIAMLKTLKKAIQEQKIEHSIAVPLLEKLKNRTINPMKTYLIYQCFAAIEYPGATVSKTFLIISSLLVACGVIHYQTDFFKKLYTLLDPARKRCLDFVTRHVRVIYTL